MSIVIPNHEGKLCFALSRSRPESVRLAQLGWLRLRCERSVTPGQQLVDPGDLVVGGMSHEGNGSMSTL